jgi:HD-GYP domain-containing protein (c-di-GMP phosphodiesterase class II)
MELGIGAILHDVGKMAIEKNILNKPGILTGTEMEMMRLHPALGFDILKKYSAQLSWLSIHVAFQHQEKFDGSGYPRGLKGYDRPYRSGLTPSEAYEFLLAGSGTHFDPDILREFLRHIALYPVGSVVKLSTGDIGIVTNVFAGLQTRPIVRLIVDSSHRLYDSYQEVDLSTKLTVFVERLLDDAAIAALSASIGSTELLRQADVG